MELLIFAIGALFGASALGIVFVFLIHRQVGHELASADASPVFYGKRRAAQAANDDIYGPEPLQAAQDRLQEAATGLSEQGWHPHGTPPLGAAIPAFLARPRCSLCRETRLFLAKLLNRRDSTHS